MERVLLIKEITTREIDRNKTLCPPNPQAAANYVRYNSTYIY